MTSPLHVVHIHPTPNVNAGSEVAMRLALEGLRATPVRSSLVCGESVEPAAIPGLDAVVTEPEIFSEGPVSPVRVRALARRLESIVTELEADVVHVHLGLRFENIERIACRRPLVYSAQVPICPNGARYLYRDGVVCDARVGGGCLISGYSVHGCGHLIAGTPVLPHAFARATYRAHRLLRALKTCRAVIAPSRWQAAHLVRDGVPTEKIRVIHPPVISCVSTPAGGPPIMAFAGRLVSAKGADHLLRASREITTPHRLWIIGDGPQRRELEELASTLGIWPHTHFHGAVPPEEARRLLGWATVVAVPSLWGEPFNLVGAQAAAGGISVAGYDVGGMRDWATKYPHAVLVPPTDYPAFVAALMERLRRLTNTRPVVVNHFSPDRHVSALIRVYRDAATGSES